MATNPPDGRPVPATIEKPAAGRVEPIEFTGTELSLIKRIFARACKTEAEWDLFLTVCRATALHPLFRQIYALRFEDQMVIHIGIQGKVAIAQRSGAYAGLGRPHFGRSVPCRWDARLTVPEDCEATVSRLLPGGRTATIVGYCRFDEFARTVFDRDAKKVRLMKMWAEKPYHMLGKCTRSQGLDLGFQNETAEVYQQIRLLGAALDTTGALPDEEDEPGALSEIEQQALTEGARRGFTVEQSLDHARRETAVREQMQRRHEGRQAPATPATGERVPTRLGDLFGMWKEVYGEQTREDRIAGMTRLLTLTRAIESWNDLTDAEIAAAKRHLSAKLDAKLAASQAEGDETEEEAGLEIDAGGGQRRAPDDAPEQGDLLGGGRRTGV